MSGSLPDGWRRVTLGEITRRRDERAEAAPGAAVYSVTKHRGFVPSLEYFDRQVFSRDTANYRVVRRGDLAYATIHLDEGSLGLFDAADTGLISPMYTVVEVTDRSVDPGILFGLLKRPSLIAQMARLGTGSVHRRKSIHFSALRRTELALPPLQEQRAIASVLDAIDDAIAQSEGVIATIGELQRAVLHELLTRGVPGQHTEWLEVPPIGTVPACWQVAPLGDLLLAVEAGGAPKRVNRPAVNDEWGVLRVGALTWGDYRPAENKALAPGIEADRALEVRPGDLLLSRANTPELVGRTVLVRKTPDRLLLSDKTLRLVPDTGKTNQAFLHAVLGEAAARNQLSAAASGSSKSMFNVSQASVRKILLPIPSRDEQRIIVRITDVGRDALGSQAAAIDQLRTVKKALSHALLTGRTRVTHRMDGSL